MGRLLNRANRACAVLLVAGLAAGCIPREGGRTLDEKEITTRLDSYAHIVEVAPDSATLSATAREDLMVFLTAVQPGYGDRLILELGDRDALRAERYAELALLLQQRYPALDVYWETAAGQPNDRVRVVLRRPVAEVQGCPDFTQPNFSLFDARPTSNFGCATAVGLAAMLADPSDLNRSESQLSSRGEQDALAFQRLRTREASSGGESEDPAAAFIAAIGGEQ